MIVFGGELQEGWGNSRVQAKKTWSLLFCITVYSQFRIIGLYRYVRLSGTSSESQLRLSKRLPMESLLLLFQVLKAEPRLDSGSSPPITMLLPHGNGRREVKGVISMCVSSRTLQGYAVSMSVRPIAAEANHPEANLPLSLLALGGASSRCPAVLRRGSDVTSRSLVPPAFHLMERPEIREAHPLLLHIGCDHHLLLPLCVTPASATMQEVQLLLPPCKLLPRE